jgi:TPR repeat protein
MRYRRVMMAAGRKDYAVALDHWRPLANAGDARAQLGLAMMYYAGHGVILDYEEALDWCSKTANQDVPQAYYMLGAMYRDGLSSERCVWRQPDRRSRVEPRGGTHGQIAERKGTPGQDCPG